MILGDGLELREAPHRDGGARSPRPFFADLGRALGPDGEIVLMAGNHDHGLVAGWIDGRLQTEPAGFLGLEQRIAPREAARWPRALAEHAAARPRCELAYPGVWLRDDVYALHGHYADVHATVPTFERLAAGAMARWVVTMPPGRRDARRLRGGPRAAVRLDARAHAALRAPRAERRGGRVRARLGDAQPAARAARPLRALALGAGYARGVARLNAARASARVERDLSGAALRRGYLHGIREVLRPPGHRRAARDLGPLAPLRARGPATTRPSGRRPPARGSSTPARGSTSRTSSATTPNGSPYWPGTRRPGRGRRAAAAHPPAGGPGPRGAGATPGVKQVAQALDARPDLELEHAGRVVRVLDERARSPARRPATARPLTRSSPAPSTHRPHAAGLVGAGVGAGLVGGLGAAGSAPGASSGRSGASGSRSTPSSSWISRSVSS